MVTLDDLKAHLAPGSTDAEKADKLTKALRIVERRCGPIQPTVITEVCTTGLLSTYPVLSVGSITAGGAPVAAAVVSPAGVVSTPVLPVTVTYTAGHADAEDLEEAVLVIAAHLLETQRGSRPLPLSGDDPPAGLGFALPNRALELMQPYLRQTLVA